MDCRGMVCIGMVCIGMVCSVVTGEGTVETVTTVTGDTATVEDTGDMAATTVAAMVTEGEREAASGLEACVREEAVDRA